MTPVVDAAVGRLLRAYADVRRRGARGGSASLARRAFESSPSDATWLEDSARDFHHYRDVIEPADRWVSVVCVTQRPALLGAVAANVARQRDIEVELVIVTNSDRFDPAAIDRVRAAFDRCTVLSEPVSTSLGSCLNAALDSCSHRFVAKFDDDDFYGAWYLADALRAHRYAGAAVVGKHTYYADVMGSGRHLRFPGHEFTYSGTLAGGTLVIDRGRTGDLRFEDRSIGEDRAFLRACHRRGLSTFSADRFGFVQHRGGDNTWSISVEDFLQGAIEVDPTSRAHAVDGRAD